jgi:hypothetical protein
MLRRIFPTILVVGTGGYVKQSVACQCDWLLSCWDASSSCIDHVDGSNVRAKRLKIVRWYIAIVLRWPILDLRLGYAVYERC